MDNKKLKFLDKLAGMEFSFSLVFWFVLAMSGLCVGGVGLMFFVNAGPAVVRADNTPPVVATLVAIPSPVFTVSMVSAPPPPPPSPPQPPPSPTPVYWGIVEDCSVYDVPFGAVIGRYPAGSVVSPIGQNGTWLRLDSGWVAAGCVGSVSVDWLPVVPFPPVAFPSPTLTPTVVAAPVVAAATVAAAPVVTVAVASPLVGLVSALPVGFNPGWCGKIRAVAVWSDAGDRFAADSAGFAYISVAGHYVVEAASGFYDWYLDTCGEYSVR